MCQDKVNLLSLMTSCSLYAALIAHQPGRKRQEGGGKKRMGKNKGKEEHSEDNEGGDARVLKSVFPFMLQE